jgi:hypothetical protein
MKQITIIKGTKIIDQTKKIRGKNYIHGTIMTIILGTKF